MDKDSQDLKSLAIELAEPTLNYRKRSWVSFLSLVLAVSLMVSIFFVDGLFSNVELKKDRFFLNLISGVAHLQTAGNVRRDLVLGENFEIDDSFELVTEEEALVEVLLKSGNLVRLGENSRATFLPTNEGVVVRFNGGDLWLNSFFAPNEILLIDRKIAVRPIKSTLAVSRITGSSSLSLVRGVAEAFVYESDVSEDSSIESINSLMLLSGNSYEFFHDSINANFRPLLYSKLVKELRQGVLTVNENSFVTKNLTHDREKANSLQKEFVDSLTLVSSFDSPAFLKQLGDLLTLTDSKLVKNAEKSIRDEFWGAISAFNADSGDAASLAAGFAAVISKWQGERSEILLAVLADLDRIVYFFDASQRFGLVRFEIEEHLLDFYLQSNLQSDFLDLLSVRLFEVLESFTFNEANALARLDSLALRLDLFAEKFGASLLAQKRRIQGMIFLINSFAFSESKVMVPKVLELKIKLENLLLDSLALPTDKIEERQTFVLENLRLLRGIRRNLFAETLSLENAKFMTGALITHVNRLSDSSSQAAITRVFATEVTEINLFWRYINSPQYSSAASSAFGATHQERFEKFLEAVGRSEQLQSLPEVLLGGESVIVNDAFDSNKLIARLADFGFTSVNVNEVSGTFIIEANYLGSSFMGKYDVSRDLVSEIVLNSVELPNSFVKLDNLVDFLRQALDPRVGISSSDVSAPLDREFLERQRLESAAKSLVSTQLLDFGIELEAEQIEVVDLNSSIFEILNFNPDFEGVSSVGFRLNSKTLELSNLNVVTDLGSVNFDENFSLNDLSLSDFLSQQL